MSKEENSELQTYMMNIAFFVTLFLTSQHIIKVAVSSLELALSLMQHLFTVSPRTNTQRKVEAFVP